MSTTTTIFSFDHGQKKMHNAIGVSESFMENLQEEIGETLKDYLFDEDRNVKDDLSPSMLVEICLHKFSYSQLVLMASFFLQNKLDAFTEMLEKKLKNTVKRIALDSDELPDHIKEHLLKMIQEGKGIDSTSAIDGNDLPQEVKDFLDSLINKQDGDGDDD